MFSYHTLLSAIYTSEESNLNCIVCSYREGLEDNVNIHNHACTYLVMFNEFVDNPEASLSWLGVRRKRSCSKKLRLRKNGRTCSQKRVSLVRILTVYISPDNFIYFLILYSRPATLWKPWKKAY